MMWMQELALLYDTNEHNLFKIASLHVSIK